MKPAAALWPGGWGTRCLAQIVGQKAAWIRYGTLWAWRVGHADLLAEAVQEEFFAPRHIRLRRARAKVKRTFDWRRGHEGLSVRRTGG